MKNINVLKSKEWLIVNINNKQVFNGIVNDFERNNDLVIPYETLEYNPLTNICIINGENVNVDISDFIEKLLSKFNIIPNDVNECGEINRYYIPTLNDVKQAKINELKYARDTEEVKPISYQGYRFDYDSKARDRINAAIIALDVSKGKIEWTTADNTEVMVNADDLRGVIAAVAMRSNELHVKYRQLKEQVEACTTKEQLEKIEW